MATIGFIGLGNMGAPMAANLVRAGHQVTGFDLVLGAVEALTTKGGHACLWEYPESFNRAVVAFLQSVPGR